MKPITVVALGPDSPGHLTLEAADALRAAKRLILRTGRHGAAGWLSGQGIAFETLDSLYDLSDDFDALALSAADAVLAAAKEGPVCYGVPDPASDRTVAALLEKGASLRVLAGVSQAGCALSAALSAGLQAGEVCVVPAAGLGARQVDAGLPLLVTELSSRLLAGEVKLALLNVHAPEEKLLFGGDLIPLSELDRQRRYDHLSYAYLPPSPMLSRARYTFFDLLDIMARLRSPEGGCPWDLEQTHQTLREYVIEEAYELVDAIDSGDMARVADELGDVLLQVVFHAQVAREHGAFTISDVTTAICHKMITRHAHIFGDIHCETPEDVLRSWEAIKKKEKGLASTAESMRDIPGHLPALMRAAKVQKKAGRVGFDWDSPLPALDKVGEETEEVRAELLAARDPEGELGDLLFAAVNAARLSGVQPEVALVAATDKFIRRFERMEAAIASDGKRMQDMTLAEMDAYWDAGKRGEREGT